MPICRPGWNTTAIRTKWRGCWTICCATPVTTVPPGTQVDITARKEEDGIVLTFHNFGHTIPPEKLDRLFEQFFRLDESRASLAIARQIVELHGGTIQAESADNQILFTLRLPLPQENRKISAEKP